MKIISIVGARPHFIKVAAVLKELPHRIVHTGQHYDYTMSKVFFDELGIPVPAYNLGIGSGSHGWQTGQALIQVEKVLLNEQPDWVLVYGDVNSTLAAALAAVKLHIPVAHVEAGLRSFNRSMPEEHNRVLTDHVSHLLFCPTQTAVDNLARERITDGVYLVGDVLRDAALGNIEIAERKSCILAELNVAPGGYFLATVHRPCNVDSPQNLRSILNALGKLGETVILPLHPRTRKMIGLSGIRISPSYLKFIAPVGYFDMLMLEKNAKAILTDSGGVQREAYIFGVPCVVLREQTSWGELGHALVGADPSRMAEAMRNLQSPPLHRDALGDGCAARAIADILTTGRF